MRSKTNSNRSEAGTKTMSEKAELEIPNFPSSTNQSSLRELARISWTLFQANSWVRRLRPFCAFQAILSNNSKDFRCPSPARIKATPFQLADI